MPYCPNCRSEYRAGFTSCKACGGLALVDELPEVLELRPEDLADSLPVGFTEGGSGRGVEVDGRVIDPSRVFLLDMATRMRDTLADHDVASLIVPVDDVFFPDNVSRFEVRVHKNVQAEAERLLVDLWRETVAAEGVEGGGPVDIDTCPACGTKVPLDVEECPDCGLV